ncbi:CDC37 [Lepeophtheirus salmonis]|uniref:CDC37 n=1 Tax=Lepeophtheirus salmonis TaxID=72036 RepID=A0A7R8D2M1_LEPSM|nr:CDC37 [Lepeophtheirus salmonis]CAF2975637.1 CDC37 [Lepeophtheirus salmonis]
MAELAKEERLQPWNVDTFIKHLACEETANYLVIQCINYAMEESLQKCFESQDIGMLQQAIKELPDEEGRYHMKRCIDSGLWLPSKEDPNTNPEDGFIRLPMKRLFQRLFYCHGRRKPLNNSPEEEIKLTLDSDSDDEEQDPKAKEDKSPDNRISSSDEEDEIKIHNGQRGKSVGRIRLDLSDDDEETNIEGEEVQNKDPSSDEDEVDSPLVLEGDEKREEDSNPEGISSMSVKERASNLFEIRSTSQRRLRESSVHIPYHIPKKLSLDEFLSRRKSGNDLNLREKEIESTYQEDEDKDVLDPELKVSKSIY